MGMSEDIAGVAIKALGNLLGEQLRGKNLARDQDEDRILEALEAHLEEVLGWSEHVQFFGMNSPSSVQSATIGLDIYGEPRRFRASQEQEVRTETDLLQSLTNDLLLGEPGSGKTTTLKRIARAILTETPQPGCDTFDLPLVIRLRELSEGESLLVRLARIYGLRVTQREVVTRIEATARRASSKEIRHIQTQVGDWHIEDIIPECLNRSRAILLLDGLDEVRVENAPQLRAELMLLGRRLHPSKIIVTCRSGDYTTQMEGFSVLEICPLSERQIRSIIERWLGNRSEGFLAELKRVPYYDLADRPLLLTQLLFLYRRYGYLPEQPAMIYRRVLRLLLEEWDAEREIARQSKYAGFDPDRKAEFLAALAYHVTYCLKEKSFTEDDLVQAYLAVHKTFNLPVRQARDVAKEIQTHTGIIVAGPRDTYEFCHLSLQEYLCANYLVRSAQIKRLTTHIASYSAPLAVAVTLSSKPGDWFGSIILEPANLREMGLSGLSSFLSRLLVEKPFFETSELLGFSLLKILASFDDERLHLLVFDLLQLDSVKDSLAKALRWYLLIDPENNKNNGLARVRLRKGFEHAYTYNIEAPALGAIPGWLLPELLERAEGRLELEGDAGRTRTLTDATARRIAESCSRGNPSLLGQKSTPP